MNRSILWLTAFAQPVQTKIATTAPENSLKSFSRGAVEQLKTDKRQMQMRRVILSLILLFGLMFAGCRTQSTSGRLDQLIITEAKSYGGVIEPSLIDSPLLGKWTLKRDKFGTVITCTGVNFQSVDQLFRNRFGSPHAAGKNGEGKAQWVIPAKVAGVSFWYSELGDGVQITVLKPDNMWH
jgi:hypothetical protein